MIKRYRIGNTIYTFDVTYTEETRCGTMWLGKCRENGKEAWLDSRGVQFIGERRVDATEIAQNFAVPHYRYMWC